MRRTLLALGTAFTLGCSSGGGTSLPGGDPVGAGGYPPCSASCASPMFVCDDASGRCVPTGCSQTGCTVAGYACDDFYDYCTTAPMCLADGNCPAGWACFEVDNTCRRLPWNGCRTTAECPSGQMCDGTTHTCTSAGNCGIGGSPCPDGWLCDPGYVCRQVGPSRCFYHSDCPGYVTGVLCVHDDPDPYTPPYALGWCSGCATDGAVCGGTWHACDTTRNSCRDCNGDADCPAPFVCGRGGCVECVDDADCGDAAKPHCFSSVCRECVTTDQCASKPGTACDIYGACRPATGGECSASGTCPADRPFCDLTTHRCRECATDGDCGSAGLRCEYYGWCEPWPAGDRCVDAVPLALASGHTILVAELSREVFRCESWCSSPNGDAFWTFTLDAPAVLEIVDVDPNYGPAKVDVLTAGCGQLLGSKARPTASAPFVTPALAAGTPYVLRVEGDADLRQYTLLITRKPPP